MSLPISINVENSEIDYKEYCTSLEQYCSELPEIAKHLMVNATHALETIRETLYQTPSFVEIIKASFPEETLQAVLTADQKLGLATGKVELMTNKNTGAILAQLRNPKTKEIVSSIRLEKIQQTPELTEAMTNYMTQMQLAKIAEQIQSVQIAIDEVHQGQESDRLAMAYSCQQKLIQAMKIKNPQLKQMALLRIVSDAEDSRNLLMQSQNSNVKFIQDQPESYIGMFRRGADQKKINARVTEIRDNLCAVNMVSLVEAMAYQEMGETDAAQVSLQYYADYIHSTYLDVPGFVDRMDMIDPSPENYWSNLLPDIKRRIQALPCNASTAFLEG